MHVSNKGKQNNEKYYLLDNIIHEILHLNFEIQLLEWQTPCMFSLSDISMLNYWFQMEIKILYKVYCIFEKLSEKCLFQSA